MERFITLKYLPFVASFYYIVLIVCVCVFFSVILFQQRVMETAEQAALSESERDSAHHHHQAQSQMSHRLYETRHQNDYMSDDIRDMPPKPMRRFEKLVVNLTHSSVLVPADVSLSGIKSPSIFR